MTDKILYRMQKVHGIRKLLKYRVIRETPTKYRLRLINGHGYEPASVKEHWMVKDANHPWARWTPREAIYSFLRRQKNYLTILREREEEAEEDIKLVEAELEQLNREEPST